MEANGRRALEIDLVGELRGKDLALDAPALVAERLLGRARHSRHIRRSVQMRPERAHVPERHSGADRLGNEDLVDKHPDRLLIPALGLPVGDVRISDAIDARHRQAERRIRL